MNHKLFEMLMTTLIMVYVFMGGIFVVYQKQGQTFIASFDKTLVWGSCLFAIACGLGALAYLA